MVKTAEIIGLMEDYGWEFGEDRHDVGDESSLGVWFSRTEWKGVTAKNPVSVSRWGLPESRKTLIMKTAREAWELFRGFNRPPRRLYNRETNSFSWQEV